MMPTHVGRTRRGMTLMELVLGLAITGMMTAAGVAAFDSIIDHRRAIHEASAATERAAVLRETIRQWTAGGAVVLATRGPQGLSRSGAGARNSRRGTASSMGSLSLAAVTPAQAQGDELVVTSSSPVPANTASLSIRLYIDVDGTTPEHGLTMEYRASPQQPITRRMLDSTIDSLRVEYLDVATHRWIDVAQAVRVRGAIGYRLTLFPDPATSPSPLVGLPFLFTRGFEPPRSRP